MTRHEPNAPGVYVVDDDDAVRDSVTVLLKSRGYEVTACSSAQAFLDRAERSAPACLLLDIRMPGMDGMSLLRLLKDDLTHLAVIMITGHGDVPTAVRAMKLGAFDFLEKPYPAEMLIDSLERALEFLGHRLGRQEANAALADRRSRLTPREREVMDHMVEGQASKEIARELDISPRTVEIHRARVFEKMEARTLAHLVRFALQLDGGAEGTY